MNTDQFWNRASDIFNLHHNKYRFTILTDREKRETVNLFLRDVEVLKCEWQDAQDNEKG